MEKTAPQARAGPGRRILTEAIVNQLPHATPSDHDVSVMSTYSVFTVSVNKAPEMCVFYVSKDFFSYCPNASIAS